MLHNIDNKKILCGARMFTVTMLHEIINTRPDRVIMNPGTESEEIEKQLTAHGKAVLRACTPVMLRSGQF